MTYIKKGKRCFPFFIRNSLPYPIFSKMRPAAFFAGIHPATIAIKITKLMTAR
jgi:hypothetical protein